MNNKLVENEQQFQETNTRMTAAAARLTPTEFPKDLVMNIYCECANKACLERLQIPYGEYAKIAKKPNHFVVIPEHLLLEFERLESRTSGYWIIVKKTDKLQKKFEL